jgi:hypothetical protein
MASVALHAPVPPNIEVPRFMPQPEPHPSPQKITTDGKENVSNVRWQITSCFLRIRSNGKQCNGNEDARGTHSLIDVQVVEYPKSR